MDLEGKWKPILIGGLIIGLAPFVPFLNLACCLIPMVGAMVSVAVYRSSNPLLLTTNDGILLGAMSGVAGTILYAILVVPVTLFIGSTLGSLFTHLTPSLSDAPPEVRPFLEFFFSNLGTVFGVALFFKVVSQLAISLIFGVLGGILGVALLKPRSQGLPPSYP